MYSIAVYVPHDHLEHVKEKMFEAGAGRVGNYQKCSFEYEGTGQFMPLPGSKPFIGEELVLERVKEVKVEMVCEEEYLSKVVCALKSAHPYETPAYYVIKMLDI